MTVTELKQISAEQYTVTFSNGVSVKTTLAVVADYSLYSGRELTDEEYAAVSSASALARCRERAMKLIGLRPYGERELYDKLVEKGESEANAADTIAWLLRMHMLDDHEYAAMLVRHYAAKGYGRRRICDEFYRRRLPRELWDEALEQMPEQDGEIDRFLSARLKGGTDRAALKKATDALLRRGFSWEEIHSAVARYNSEIEEDY